VVDRVRERLRFNTAAVRSGLANWTGRYRASELAARLGYYAVLLFALQLGFSYGPILARVAAVPSPRSA
jgi:hypothetical protein